MIYMICPECGDLLRHRCIVYEDELQKICNELNIDYNSISQEGYENNEIFVEKKKEIINKICVNLCCKMNMLTYINLTKLIK